MLKVPFYPYATKVNRRQIVARAYQKRRRLSSQTSLQLQCRLGISQDLTTRMVQSQVRVATRWSLHKLSWKDITSDRSLVYHSYITDGLGAEGQQHDGDRALPPNHLTSYSDMPMARSTQEHPLPSEDEARRWLDIYFCFATPTYRYLHRPTLEDWMSQYLAGNSVPVAHAACALLTSAALHKP